MIERDYWLYEWGHYFETDIVEHLIILQFKAKITGYHTRYPVEYYVIQNEQKDVGYICIYQEDQLLRVIDFKISSEYRNKGIGKRVINSIQRKAKEGKQTIYLTVAKGNIALRLYIREGFKIKENNDTDYQLVWE